MPKALPDLPEQFSKVPSPLPRLDQYDTLKAHAGFLNDAKDGITMNDRQSHARHAPLWILLAQALGMLLCIELIEPATAQTSALAPAGVQTPWLLIWRDEFNGAANTGVDSANWLYDLGKGYGCAGCPSSWGTGEVETMTNSTANVYQDGAGHLAIKPIRSPGGAWTSGRIETRRTDFQPPATDTAPSKGVLAIEASIQQPNVSGAAAAGYWPAFWTLGAPFRGNYLNWPGIGEIDMMEDINGRSSVFGTLHCGSAPNGPCNEFTGLTSGEHACPGCQAAFHTYRMELDKSITPNQIRWYLDDVNFFTVNSTQIDAPTWAAATDHGFFIILNVAIGGSFPGAFGGGPTDATVSGVPMLIDYVRVYVRPFGASYLPLITR